MSRYEIEKDVDEIAKRSAETKERSRKLIEELETAHRIHQQTLVLETITVIVIVIRSILIVLQSRGLI